MRSVQLRHAKAAFSAIIQDAEQGHATVVTKNGRPAAMIVPIEDGRRIYADKRPPFASLLMRIPHELEIERDRSPVREVDL